MPPKEKAKAPLPPVPGVEESPPKLCEPCFPEGLAGTPAGATVISCGHGAWRVADLAEKKDDLPPPGGQGGDESQRGPDGEQPPEDPGGGKGDGAA